MRKRFDRELYNQTDKLAKTKLFSLLEYNDNIQASENPKKTGVDILVTNPDTGDLLFNIETEIKRVWKGEKFPYESVQIPERKKKYTGLGKPTLFVMFNEDQTKYLVIRDTDLISSPLVEVPNKYVYKGELFFQVPLEKVSFNNIKKPIKEIINAKND